MLTLCIDTAYKYLTCVLIKDGKIVGKESYECFKKQSEEVFVCLDKLFKDTKIKKLDIDSLCISKGPGSYTGVRIAMSLAKVFCEVQKIDLYTISTLRLYAGNKPKTMVILNARANRAYVGTYDLNKCEMQDCVLPLEQIKADGYSVLGDGSLIGLDDINIDIPQSFLATKDSWQKVEKIAYLVPEYLKESESYFVA